MRDAWIVQGLGFGDEGKGTIVDSLARTMRADLVVRFNGGPQAAHHVVLPDGRWHSFHQFGSATFAGVRTHLSHHVLLDPFSMQREAATLTQLGAWRPWARLSADPRCLIITPYQMALNRLRELSRGQARHGSCGFGVGECVSDAIENPSGALRLRALSDECATQELLETSRTAKLGVTFGLRLRHDRQTADLMRLLNDTLASRIYAHRYKQIARLIKLSDDLDALSSADRVVFEGAQGVMLDEHFGFEPHTTWSRTTFINAEWLCNTVGVLPVRIGVLRSYITRHGAGPLLTDGSFEDEDLHNVTGEWQGHMRSGAFDVPLAQYAVEVSRPDVLALTHLDKVRDPHLVCTHYDRDGGPVYARVANADEFVNQVCRLLKRRLWIRSYGPTYREKQYRRTIANE